MSKTNATNSTSNKCKKCKHSVSSGLKCVVCGSVSHRSCLNALKSVKFIDDTTVNCCVDIMEDVTVEASISETTDELKIRYLEEIIKQKDLVIENQAIAIKSLQDQLAMVRNMPPNHSQYKEPISKPQGNSKAVNYAGALSKNQNNSTEPLGKNKPSGSSNRISPTAVSHAIHVAQSSRICQDVVHLNQTVPVPALPVAQPGTQLGQRGRSRNILVGDAKELASTTSLKSANETICKHFHTTNWDPNTKEEVLLNYLKEFSQKVSVEKLNSRDPERYASFKVSVPLSDVSSITKPEIWPCGVRVNQFFRSRNQNAVS